MFKVKVSVDFEGVQLYEIIDKQGVLQDMRYC